MVTGKVSSSSPRSLSASASASSSRCKSSTPSHSSLAPSHNTTRTRNTTPPFLLSRRTEEILCELEADPTQNLFGDDDEVDLAERALAMAVDETKGQAWAKGGRALRMGEIILIVDSDTQVPEDCFRDAARELAESPELAILQNESDGESHSTSQYT